MDAVSDKVLLQKTSPPDFSCAFFPADIERDYLAGQLFMVPTF